MKAIINAFDWVGLNYDGEAFFINQKEQKFIKYILINY